MDAFLELSLKGTLTILAFLMLFWEADYLLSDEGRKQLYASLASALGASFDPLTIMNRYFSGTLPFLRFILNVLVFSCVPVLVLLVAYVTYTPGFSAQLIDDNLARMNFLRVLFYGIVATFTVNYLVFALYSYVEAALDIRRFKVRYILIVDILSRVVLYVVVTAILFVVAAMLTEDAFLGKKMLAILSVAPTVRHAAAFQDMSGAFLYATAISALPLFLGACIELMQESPVFSGFIRGFFFFLPFADKPIRAISLVVGTFFAIFGIVALGIASLI